MDNHTLTVFTPAYNRANTLIRTYESLCRQTSKDFEWLIVDDGSTDNTRELVENWIKENKISIRYIYQKNGGMHTAHNTAYENITTELNTCIDSDDYMPDDAVEKIVTFWKANGSDKYAGILGLDRTVGGEILGAGFPADMKSTTLSGYYARMKTGGDMKIVLRTDVVRKYPKYPVFQDEKYVGLAYLYYLIDQDYELLVLNEVLVIVDYQVDGSSSTMYRQYWNNPKGFAFYHNNEMFYARSLKRKIKSCILYVSHCLRAGNHRIIQESNCPWLTLLCFPIGIAAYFVIRYNVKKDTLKRIPK